MVVLYMILLIPSLFFMVLGNLQSNYTFDPIVFTFGIILYHNFLKTSYIPWSKFFLKFFWFTFWQELTKMGNFFKGFKDVIYFYINFLYDYLLHSFLFNFTNRVTKFKTIYALWVRFNLLCFRIDENYNLQCVLEYKKRTEELKSKYTDNVVFCQFIEIFVVRQLFNIWVLSEILFYLNTFNLNIYNNLMIFYFLLPLYISFIFCILYLLFILFILPWYHSRTRLILFFHNIFFEGLIAICLVIFCYNYLIIDNLFNFFYLDFTSNLSFKFWLIDFNITISIDFFSIIMVCLTLFIYLGSFLSTFSDIELKISISNLAFWLLRFSFISLICQSMLFFFLVWDLFLMFFFFELTVIPLCGLLGKWGYNNKYWAFLFLISYTILSSLCFLFLIIISQWLFGLNLLWTNRLNFSFESLTIQAHLISSLLVILAAALKLPVIPFHIWLPEAHVESPTVGSMLLAGILLKAGVYLLYRFFLVFFINGEVLTHYMDIFIYIGLISSLVSFFIAFSQIDFKRCIAYLSVAHMSVILSGLLSHSYIAKLGCFLMSLSHGIIAATLFYLCGLLSYRYGTRSLYEVWGLIDLNPNFGVIIGFFFINNSGLPGTLSFRAEFLIILGLSYISLKYVYVMIIPFILNGLLNFYLFSLIILGNPLYIGYSKKKINNQSILLWSLNLFLLLIWLIFASLLLIGFGLYEPYTIILNYLFV